MSKLRSKSERRERSYADNRVQALLGGTPGRMFGKKPMPLETEFEAQAESREKRRTTVSKYSKLVLAPLTQIISADSAAIKAAYALRQLGPPARPRRVKAHRPNVASQVRAGSILTFRGTPYDDEWTAASQQQGLFGSAKANKATGIFEIKTRVDDSQSGTSWAAAGVAVWFRPIAENTWVRFAADAPGSGEWDDNSWGFAAHNDAFMGVLIESWDLRAGNYRLDVDRRVPLWSDGTGWFEEHSDSPSPWFPSDTYFSATSTRWYRVWIWAQASCDAEGAGAFGSSANATLSFQSWFTVFEQWT